MAQCLSGRVEIAGMDPQTYYFVAASQSFLESEPLQEVLEERTRHYQEHNRPIDFFYVTRPAFLGDPSFRELHQRLEEPVAAVVSTDAGFIRWLKVRLTFVESGQFQAPTPTIPDPLASVVE
ncbi:MAG: DUF2488 family protein [Thermostichales cyanobacterium GMQP_bins_62]